MGVGILADLRAPEQIQHVAETHLLAVDQVLAVAGFHNGVFILGSKKIDIICGHQPHLLTDAGPDPF